MYYVYVIYSEKLKKRYVGFTDNVEKRLYEHNHAKSKFTKSGIPWKLLYVEEFENKSDTRKRELFLICKKKYF